jgi:hypothetical protein
MSLFSIQPHHPGAYDPYAPAPLSLPNLRASRSDRRRSRQQPSTRPERSDRRFARVR